MEIRSCARPRLAAAAASSGQRLKRGWRFVAPAAFAAALYDAGGGECMVAGMIGALVKRTNRSLPCALTRARLWGAIFFFQIQPREGRDRLRAGNVRFATGN